jgi:diphthamide biosynthesis protein 3
MSIFHDEVEIEDFEYNEETEMYYYPCPCGDRFQISKVYLKLFNKLFENEKQN